MKLRFVRMIGIIAICVFMVRRVSAQSSEYHQLNAEEFEGVPDQKSADMIAFTNCFIDFNYRAKSEKGVYRLTCEVSLVFDHEKSWINKKKVLSRNMMDEILNHEQGHYIIAYMEQQELMRTIAKTYFDANYKYEASNMFARVHEKYKQLSLDYDEDTSHMLNKQQQHSWDAYFKKRLTYAPQEELARR